MFLIPCPTFSEYENAAKFFGGNIISFKSLNLNKESIEIHTKNSSTWGNLFL